MNNTTQRVLSAFVLVFIIYLFSLFGQIGIKLLLLFSGAILVDETVGKMLKTKRSHFGYWASQLSFISGFLFFTFVDRDRSYYIHFINAAIGLNICLLIYLYRGRMESLRMIKFLKRFSFLVGIMFLMPFMAMSFLFFKQQWLAFILFLLIFNFSVDTGAWFFGKHFGKRKLWPSISPKKTQEGALGGSIFATIVASLISYFFFEKLTISLIFFFFLMSIFSQLGDLIESKLKRQLKIKDSSNLIPGHGGIYDRIDSLIYVAPLFVFVVKYFY